jgi:streptogramin lyase
VDWNGKLLKTVMTNCRNCSGMAYGDGHVWMMANQPPQGCFQVDMNGKQISHRQIPLAMPGQDGGGSHGAQWRNGKLWIAALRPKLLLRVDPKTWVPEVAIAAINSPEKPRSHDLTFDANGDIWLVTGNDSRNYKEGKPGLTKYDGKTGQVIGMYDFLPGSADPHGLEFHNGTLISCDAGIHPGWPNGDSPHAGWVFKIEPA